MEPGAARVWLIHGRGDTAQALGNPQEGTAGLGDRAEETEAASAHGGSKETSPGWDKVEETKWETKEETGIRHEADQHGEKRLGHISLSTLLKIWSCV